MDEINLRLQNLQKRLKEIEKKFNRPENSVVLLAATKGQSIETINEAILAGQTIFGESYLQEALPKINYFAHVNLEWHFIGQIQRNKTRKIAEHFDWVQSVSSELIAKRLSESRPTSMAPLNICLEINVSHEKNKSGANTKDIFKLAEYCSHLPNLKLRGLMAIPAYKETEKEQRLQFQQIKKVFDQLSAQFTLDTLSMGMSHDWEAAIAEGATLIRIGTFLFGKRD